MLFLTSIDFTGYYARTETPAAAGAQVAGTSYRGRFDFTTDRYGAAAEHMLVGPGFEPEVGFVRRTDVRRSFGQLRFSPRPARNVLVRKLTWQAGLDYITDAAAIALQNREASGLFRIDFQSSDWLAFEHSREYELLPGRFQISPGIIVPAGGYDYHLTRASYNLGQQRPLSGSRLRPAPCMTARGGRQATTAAGESRRASRWSRR
jgi:hypothetical protein